MEIVSLSYGTKIPLCAFDFVALLENVEGRYEGLVEPRYRRLFFDRIEVPLSQTFLDVIGRVVAGAGDGFSGIGRRVEDSVERVAVYAGCLEGLGYVAGYLKESSQSDVFCL
jgi:hypothetical protein